MKFWTGRDGLCFWITFSAALAVYVYSLPPSITLEDAGELAVAADHLGIPHPPGYPLWTLLGWIFSLAFRFVQFRGYSNPAWGISFMSAFFGSLSCGLTAVCIRKLCRILSEAPTENSKWNSRGLAGLLALGCWIATWTTLRNPSIGILLGVTLAGTLILYALSMGLRRALRHSLDNPDRVRDIQACGIDVWMGIAGGLLLAFSPLMWSQSVMIEVYSLNAFFVSALLLLVLTYIQNPRDSILYLTGFLFALGLGNHHSLLFFIFFLAAGLIAAHCRVLPRKTEWPVVAKKALTLLGLGILGLSVYVYMPLASSRNPPMNWGNTQTWEGFRHVVTRGQYERFSLMDNLREITFSSAPSTEPEASSEDEEQIHHRRTLFVRMLGAYIHDPAWKTSIASQFSWQFPLEPDDPTGTRPPPPERQIPLALIGLIPLLCFPAFPRNARRWFLCSMVAFFFVTVVFLTIQWPELTHSDLWVKRVQYLPSHILFAIWMGLGAHLLILLLHAALPKRSTLLISAAAITGLFIFFPLHKDARDPAHLEQLGSSNQRGHDFGWEYGFHMLRGANGILLDELAHHPDPDCLINDWTAAYLRERNFPGGKLTHLKKTATDPMPLSEFRNQVLRPLKLSKADARLLREAATLAAFRALSPEEQAENLVYLHRPLPDWDYPPEMDQEGILFGGTDPGRFVPTYMVFSTGCRPDLFVLTQTALADPTYQTTIRDFYGDQIALPESRHSNRAYLDYGNELRLFDPEAFYNLMLPGDTLAVQGIREVNRVNGFISRWIVDQNAPRHSFYLEEAVQLDWMIPHQRPHGLLFKIEAEPVELSRREMRRNRDFWNWYEEHLNRNGADASTRNRFQRNLAVRQSFSKLRLSQAWNYFERGHHIEAEQAMDQAIRLYPANPEASLRAADLYMRMLKFDRAEELLTQLSAHDPHHPQIPAFMRSLEKLRELNDMRLELERTHQLRITGNTTVQLLTLYGQLEMREQMYEMAEMLLRLPSIHVDFFIHLADFMRARENKTYYVKAVNEWAERDPQDPQAQIELAVIALSEERDSDMMEHLVHAVQLAPDAARTLIARDPRFIDIHHWTRFQRLVRFLH
jgi:tetratricopeptide (TPR) repeat protein